MVVKLLRIILNSNLLSHLDHLARLSKVVLGLLINQGLRCSLRISSNRELYLLIQIIVVCLSHLILLDNLNNNREDCSLINRVSKMDRLCKVKEFSYLVLLVRDNHRHLILKLRLKDRLLDYSKELRSHSNNKEDCLEVRHNLNKVDYLEVNKLEDYLAVLNHSSSSLKDK